MLEKLITLGYVLGALGLVGSVFGYLIAPRLIKTVFAVEEEKDEQSNG